MMKRFIPLILCITMLFNVLMPATMVTATDATINITKEQVVLRELGIIEKFDSLDFKVTREDFVTYAAKMLKLEPTTNKTYFADLSLVKNAGYINAGLEYELIDRAPDNKFNPDNYVTFEQAYKILVCATGFRTYAEYYGGTLSAYTNVAKKLGIALNVSASQEITLKEAMILLYRALTINMSSVYGANEDGLLSSVDMGKNVMGEYHNTYEYTGRVESVLGATMTSNAVDSDAEAYISGKLFQIAEGVQLRNYFGEYIRYVYQYDKSTDTETIIYAERYDDEQVLEIKSSQIVKYDSNTRTLDYYKTDDAQRPTSITIASGATILNNGTVSNVYLSTLVEDMMSGELKGIIKVVKENKENKVLVVNTYETYLANSFDITNQIIYDKNDSNNVIRFSDYKTVTILDEKGAETDMPSSYPVPISVSKAYDKSSLEIRVYSGIVIGKISNIKQTQGKIQIDDTEYQIDKAKKAEILPTLKNGLIVEAYVDFFGEIVYLIPKTEEMEVGYLVAAGSKEEAFSTYEIQLKIFGHTTKMNVYSLAKIVTIDGVRYKQPSPTQLATIFPGSNSSSPNLKLQEQVIRFKTNSAGEINVIDTYNVSAYEDEKTTLKPAEGSGTTQTYYSDMSRWGLKNIVSGNAKQFRVPILNEAGQAKIYGDVYTSPTDDMYQAEAGGYFANLDRLALDMYTYKNEGMIDVIVRKVTGERDENANLYMFDSVSETLNENGDVVKNIHAWYKTGEASFEVLEVAEGDLVGLKKGDIIKITLDHGKVKVSKITKMFDAESKVIIPKNNTPHEYDDYIWESDANYKTTQTKSLQIYRTYPVFVTPSIITGAYELYDAADGKVDTAYKIQPLKIIVYDPARRTDPIYMGTERDITTYNDAGANCDVIVAHTKEYNTYTLFVFK